MRYPPAKKVNQVEDRHGIQIADPYRWLEDLDSAETKAWVEEQNRLTFGYLSEIAPRIQIRDRLTKVWNYEKYWVFKSGGRYFQFKNSGLQNQDILYKLKSLQSEPEELLNPNRLSDDGTVALSGLGVSAQACPCF